MNKAINSLLTLILVISVIVPCRAVEYDFSYANPEGPFNLLGYERADHYDVGIYIPADGLTEAKAKLSKITALGIKHDNITNYKMWASTKFDDPGVGIHFSGDIYNCDATIEETADPNLIILSGELDKECKISDAGIYVGFSFDVTAIDRSNYTKYPIVITPEANGEEAMMVRGAKNNHAIIALNDVSLCCIATFEGDFYTDAVRIIAEPIYAIAGKEADCNATIINQGINTVNSIEYAYEVNGLSGTAVIDVNLTNRTGASQDITFSLPASDETGLFTGKLEVTKVNGNANSANPTFTTLKYNVLDHMTTHRPVLEEFTGTWCGWCPRGMAGLQKCKDEIDDFIAIAYHGRDPMELAADTPENPAGYPYCSIDRVIYGDPYYGSPLTEPGYITVEYLDRKAVFAPADIDVKAEWNDDKTSLLITSTTTFAYIPDDGYNYRIGYVVIEDGMHGETADWLQTNYYSKSQGKGDPYLNQYYEAAGHIAGVEYNDVAVFTTNVRGINKSLPKTNELEVGVPYEHTYEAKLENFLNKDKKPSYQNIDNMRVVALLIKQDSNNGSIANANIANIGEDTGIIDIEQSQHEVINVEYYDITGKRIINPSGKFCIQKETLDNGEIRVSKVIK